MGSDSWVNDYSRDPRDYSPKVLLSKYFAITPQRSAFSSIHVPRYPGINPSRVCFRSVLGFETCRGEDGSSSLGSIGGLSVVIGFNGLTVPLRSPCCRAVLDGRERQTRSCMSDSVSFDDSCTEDRGLLDVSVLFAANTDFAPLANGLRDSTETSVRVFASVNSLSTLSRLPANWWTMSATASELRLCKRARSTLKGLFSA